MIKTYLDYDETAERSDDRLSKILRMQRSFMDIIRVGISSSEMLNDLREAAMGIVIEGAEVLDEFNKAHRNWKNPNVDVPHIVEELIDTLFFLSEAFVLFELSGAEIYTMYKTKLAFNLNRILEKKTTRVQRTVLILELVNGNTESLSSEELVKRVTSLRSGDENIPLLASRCALGLMELGFFGAAYKIEDGKEMSDACFRWTISPVNVAKEWLNDVYDHVTSAIRVDLRGR